MQSGTSSGELRDAVTDNALTLIGTLTRDPTISTVGRGTRMCRFTLAMSHQYKEGDVKKTQTNYYEVRSFADLAVNFAESCRRGDSVIVVGKLSQHTHIDSGKPSTVVEIFAQHIGLDFLQQSTPFDESAE